MANVTDEGLTSQGMTATAAARATVGEANLSAIADDALEIKPPLYFNSIFGPPRSWIPPHPAFSELGLLYPWRPLRTLKYLMNTWIPSIPLAPPAYSPPLLDSFLWQPTVILQRPDHNGSYTTYPDEAWFFVNGIMTNDDVAQINAALLSELFHRPVTLIQNSTSSLISDLLQCAIDKMNWRIVEPVTKTFPVIYDALKSPYKKRVVLVAHSQGTIIAASVLRLLKEITRPKALPGAPAPAAAFAQAQIYAPPVFIYPDETELVVTDFAPLEEEELAKLEIYCFATCANVMTAFRSANGANPSVPYMEHFGNENDIVARLGMLAPHADLHGIRIEGVRFLRRGAWGHLLNAHYLHPIASVQRHGRKRGGTGDAEPFDLLGDQGAAQTPRLYAYINGGEPAA